MSPAQVTHDPDLVTTSLLRKLSSRERNVSALLGAGASRAAGVPDVMSLTATLADSVSPSSKALLLDRGIEGSLTYLRQIQSLLGVGQLFDGWDSSTARAADQEIAHKLIAEILAAPADIEPFVQFARWVTGSSYVRPIEIYTTNYDLLIERGHESVGQPYFDGFVGTYRGTFRPDLIDMNWPEPNPEVPESRIWKLHGSFSWILDAPDSPSSAVVRIGTPASQDEQVLIHPSSSKYEDSRRAPFVVMFDRFRRSLTARESLILIAGYSFGDDHVNELVFDAAQVRPRSETVVFCHQLIPEKLAKEAERLANITVLGPKEGILGGVRAPWSTSSERATSLYWSRGELTLGDFSSLANFLAQQWSDNEANSASI